MIHGLRHTLSVAHRLLRRKTWTWWPLASSSTAFRTPIPKSITRRFLWKWSDLLVRNPHIQGSNLFVRLRRLLEAGGFDESLTSTTDRDICIRLADLGSIRYEGLREDLVHHYADNDRPRLSTPGSEAKRAGLRYFFRKYRGRMTDEQQACVHWKEAGGCSTAIPPSRSSCLLPQCLCQTVTETSISETPLTLVAGAITSPDTRLVERLLNSLVEKIGGREGVILRVVLLENGGLDPFSRQKLQDVVRPGN